MKGYSSLRRLLVPILAYKAVFFAVVILSLALLPDIFNINEYFFNFKWPDEPPDFWTPFKTWDAQHYLFVSHNGHSADNPSALFFPLWPLIIRLGALLTGGHHLASALILSNLFSVAGLVLFHRFAEENHDRATADTATLLLVAFPGSLFFGFAYTESLFFMISMAFFLMLYRRRLREASALAFLLPLIRPVGILIAVPLFFRILGGWRLKRFKTEAFLALLAPLAGTAVFFAYMGWATGNPWEYFEAQEMYYSGASVWNLLHPSGLLSAFFHPFRDSGPHGWTFLFDRACFVVFLAALPSLWNRRTYFSYALVMGVVSAGALSFVAFPRFLSVIFPFFLSWGARYSQKNLQFSLRMTVASMALLQAVFLVAHINNYWVG